MTFVGRGAKTEYRLSNQNRKIVDKYIVDDCLLRLRIQEEKCDFLFLVIEKQTAYFIECKGSDVLKAVSQLNSSIDILANSFSDYVLKGRIISTKVYSPDLRTQAYTKLREKLKGNLEVKNKIFTETI